MSPHATSTTEDQPPGQGAGRSACSPRARQAGTPLGSPLTHPGSCVLVGRGVHQPRRERERHGRGERQHHELPAHLSAVCATGRRRRARDADPPTRRASPVSGSAPRATPCTTTSPTAPAAPACPRRSAAMTFLRFAPEARDGRLGDRRARSPRSPVASSGSSRAHTSHSPPPAARCRARGGHRAGHTPGRARRRASPGREDHEHRPPVAERVPGHTPLFVSRNVRRAMRTSPHASVSRVHGTGWCSSPCPPFRCSRPSAARRESLVTSGGYGRPSRRSRGFGEPRPAVGERRRRRWAGPVSPSGPATRASAGLFRVAAQPARCVTEGERQRAQSDNGREAEPLDGVREVHRPSGTTNSWGSVRRRGAAPGSSCTIHVASAGPKRCSGGAGVERARRPEPRARLLRREAHPRRRVRRACERQHHADRVSERIGVDLRGRCERIRPIHPRPRAPARRSGVARRSPPRHPPRRGACGPRATRSPRSPTGRGAARASPRRAAPAGAPVPARAVAARAMRAGPRAPCVSAACAQAARSRAARRSRWRRPPAR